MKPEMMRKFFALLCGLLFITSYGIGAVLFDSFSIWYDTGQWDYTASIHMGIGGFLGGSLALIIEIWLYRKRGLLPNNLFWFILRVIGFSVFYLAISFAIGILLYFFASNQFDSSFLIVIPFATFFYLPMMTPFGMVIGFINGLLLKWNVEMLSHLLPTSEFHNLARS